MACATTLKTALAPKLRISRRSTNVRLVASLSFARCSGSSSSSSSVSSSSLLSSSDSSPVEFERFLLMSWTIPTALVKSCSRCLWIRSCSSSKARFDFNSTVNASSRVERIRSIPIARCCSCSSLVDSFAEPASWSSLSAARSLYSRQVFHHSVGPPGANEIMRGSNNEGCRCTACFQTTMAWSMRCPSQKKPVTELGLLTARWGPQVSSSIHC
mmetsp:Transcript_9604/g.23272  ORF Transcript_9604/g.23272 Transcript_9604/m.23272 type:complete len:214 (-) Transcript_9604:765-1406(-)